MTEESKLAVRAKPAAITAANALGLAVAGVAAGGAMAVGAVAAVVLGGAAVKGYRSTSKSKSARAARAGRSQPKGTASRTQSRRTASKGTGRGPLAAVARAVRGKGKGTTGGGTASRSKSRGTQGKGTVGGTGGTARRGNAKGLAARAGNGAWKATRTGVQRHIMGRDVDGKGRARKGKGRGRGSSAETAKKKVGGQTVEATQEGLALAAPVTARGSAAASSQRTASGMPVIASTSTSGGIMYQEARKIQEYAASFDNGEPGMIEILDRLTHEVMPAITTFADAIGIIVSTSKGKFPLDASILAKFNTVQELLDTSAGVARNIPNDIEIVHKEKLDELRRPGVGAERWDHTYNAGRV